MPAPDYPIWVVDDEDQILETYVITLRMAGFSSIRKFNDGRLVLQQLPNIDCALILLDLNMPGVSGLDILDRLQAERPDIPVVVVTGVDDLETAVRCMRKGAFDYLLKPVEPERLSVAVSKALSHSIQTRQHVSLRQRLFTNRLEHPEAFAEIISEDQKMKSVFHYLEVIAPASDPVLITGETGTGKDLIAAALHRLSGRTGACVGLNVAGLDDTIFSDTLFGHVKGAFTNAADNRLGMVGQARNGSLFLDEIGDLPMSSQVKLLKLLQDREYYPLGSDRPMRSQTRFIAATNQDLEARMKSGLFRRDLFHRLNTYHVHLPPLRERGEDILLLAEHYLEHACSELKRPLERIGYGLISLLHAYKFPGNVRELRAMIFGAVAAGGLSELERQLRKRIEVVPPRAISPAEDRAESAQSLPTLEQAVHNLIQDAMRLADGNQAQAAKILGITRQSLHKRLKKTK